MGALVQSGKPWDFQAIGKGHAVNNVNVTFNNATPATLLTVPVGNSGVVRAVEIILFGNAWLTTRNEVTFNIKYDGESSPSVSVPLLSLLGAAQSTNYWINDCAPETDFWQILTPPNTGSSSWAAYRLTMPIPYTNGITIYLTGTASQAATLWYTVHYQDQLPACPNRNLRYLPVRSTGSLATPTDYTGTARRISIASAANADGSHTVTGTGSGTDFTGYTGKYFVDGSAVAGALEILSVTDSTHCTVDVADIGTLPYATPTPYFLCVGQTLTTRAAGKSGYIVGVTAGFSPSVADFGYLEGNLRMRLNQDVLVSWEYSGTEDLLGAVNYAAHVRPHGRFSGITCYNLASAIMAGYRVLTDAPVPYTNGAVVFWPHEGPANGTLTTDFVTHLYEGV